MTRPTPTPAPAMQQQHIWAPDPAPALCSCPGHIPHPCPRIWKHKWGKVPCARSTLKNKLTDDPCSPFSKNLLALQHEAWNGPSLKPCWADKVWETFSGKSRDQPYLQLGPQTVL